MLFARRIHNGAQVAGFGLALRAVIVPCGSAGVVKHILRDSGAGLLTRIPGLLPPAIAVQLVAGAVRAFVTQG